MKTAEIQNITYKHVDKEDVLLLDFLELSITANNKREHNRIKAKVEKDARSYNETAKMLFPFLNLLHKSVDINNKLDYELEADKLFRNEWVGYYPYWIYDSINVWISRKSEPPSSKDKKKLNDLLLLMERMEK